MKYNQDKSYFSVETLDINTHLIVTQMGAAASY